MVMRQTVGVAKNLKPLGWSLITLDDCWGGPRLPNGSYSWDPERFPSGMPALARFVRSHGLQLGLYMAAGNQTCNSGGRPYPIPGSLGHYDDDAATLVGWGVTYIKLTWCGYFPPLQKNDPAEQRLKPKLFAQFSRALNKTGVPVFLSGSSALCDWENGDFPPDFGACTWAPKVLNAWRIGGDHHDWWWPADDPKWKPGTWAGSWGEFSSTRFKIENLNDANQAGLAGPGGYNDPDFLFTGGQGCGGINGSGSGAHCPAQTDIQYRTAYTMWAIGAAPLIIAVDVANMTAAQAETLLNPEIPAMHQDRRGSVGKRVLVDRSCVQHSPTPQPATGAKNPVGIFPPCQVWSKTLSSPMGAAAQQQPSRAVALYNSDDVAHVIHCDLWAVFGADAPTLGPSSRVALRDLWARRDLGTIPLSAPWYNATVPASGVVLLKAVVARPPTKVAAASESQRRARTAVKSDDVKGNAAAVPSIEIAPGVRMPLILDGVSDRSLWIAAGGRGLDTALTYGSADQRNVGAAIKASGLPRSSFFVISKVPCCAATQFPFGPAEQCRAGPSGTRNTTADVEATLGLIGVEYVDLMLLHWPCDDFSKTVAAWRMMEPLVRAGKARAIGVSNLNASALSALLQLATVTPAVNQCGYSVGMHANETGPQGPGSLWGRDDATVAACRAAGVSYSAYSPLGGWTGATVLQDPSVIAIARAHNRSAAAVAMRWVVQQNISAVTSASKVSYAADDLGIFDFELSEAEMRTLTTVRGQGSK
jgi:diketogulonate reductase-like aldo/keto reductase